MQSERILIYRYKLTNETGTFNFFLAGLIYIKKLILMYICFKFLYTFYIDTSKSPIHDILIAFAN